MTAKKSFKNFECQSVAKPAMIRVLLLAGLLGGISFSCTNPAKTEQKAVEGGERAINKARDLQKTIDSTGQNVTEQEKSMESAP